MDTFDGNSQDPLSLHKYLYCSNNPVNRTDPSGNFADAISLTSGTGIAVGLAAFATASVFEAKTHAIGNLLVLTTGAAGELLDEFSAAAQTAIATAESEILVSYQSLSSAISKARQIFSRFKLRLRIKGVVPMPKSVIPGVAAHVASAQLTPPFQPFILTRVNRAQARLNRAAALRGIPPAGVSPSGVRYSLDEYPFASSAQGGAGASVAAVPLRENFIQGGIIAASYMLERINVNDNYLVIVIP